MAVRGQIPDGAAADAWREVCTLTGGEISGIEKGAGWARRTDWFDSWARVDLPDVFSGLTLGIGEATNAEVPDICGKGRYRQTDSVGVVRIRLKTLNVEREGHSGY